MRIFIKAYGITLLVFTALEMAWLSLAAPSLYSPALDPIMAAQPNAIAGLAFFIIYPLGIAYFAILPSHWQWQRAFTKGALLGFLCYATYDLTNFATLKGWTITIMAHDLIWGAILTGLSAAITVALCNKLSPKVAIAGPH